MTGHCPSNVLAVIWACVLLGWALPAAAGADKWWLLADVQRQLGLTTHQVRELDTLFEGTLGERRRLRIELDRLEAKLARAMNEGREEDAFGLIPRVESARAARNIARTMLLVRMYRVLKPNQRRIMNERVWFERGSPIPRAVEPAKSP